MGLYASGRSSDVDQHVGSNPTDSTRPTRQIDSLRGRIAANIAICPGSRIREQRGKDDWCHEADKNNLQRVKLVVGRESFADMEQQW